MEEMIKQNSQKFWDAIRKRDVETMRNICDDRMQFVHIGGTCSLDQELKLFIDGVFQPTKITIHHQDQHGFGDIQILLTDCDYALLLNGKHTSHHFMVTEVYQKQDGLWKLIQLTFTALLN